MLRLPIHLSTSLVKIYHSSGKTKSSMPWMNSRSQLLTVLPSSLLITCLANQSPLLLTPISWLAIFQDNKDGRHWPSWFGSITWNDHESHCSQAKLELYSHFQALRAVKVWIIGVKNFTIEVDTKYIKGMLNNPNIQLNAAMNCWIASILTFDFILKHVSATSHQGLDGLSRRWQADEGIDDEEEMLEEIEDWLDEVLACGIWVLEGVEEGRVRFEEVERSKQDR